MKKEGKAILVLLALLLCAGVGILTSRHRANRIADAIMQPIFQQGWFRGATHPVVFLNDKCQPSWSIQYEMDHPTAIIDFGPQFLISWSGTIIMMSPDDLKERINESMEAVEQEAEGDAVTRAP